MNFIKKLLLIVALASCVSVSKAVTLTWVAGGTVRTNSLLATNGAVITAIRVSGVASSVTFGVIDSPSSAILYTNTGYTNFTFTTGTVTNTYTNILGTIETNTYSALIATTNSAGGTNFNYPLLTTIVGATNVTVTLNPNNPYKVFQGILITNNGAGTISVDYSPLK